MSGAGQNGSIRILVVRLGAMGDIIHALPAAASLKRSFPKCRLTWIVEPQWTPLLEQNPFVDRLVILRRGSLRGLWSSWNELRSEPYDLAVDLQGLLKSALTASASRAESIYGFDASQVRERAAAWFYSRSVRSSSVHVVDRNLDLAAAAGATDLAAQFPLPPGRPGDGLPGGEFVLTSPLAGWRSKQWPLEHYRDLAARIHRELGMSLVVDTPPGVRFEGIEHTAAHHSTLAGLIYATRRAAAVVGVDSGPMHLAAALGKPGVAIFGPTDPARNGPYGETIRVLRHPGAETTYKRESEISESMQRISPDQVFYALRAALRCPVR
jgi:heptosyltransferase-1